MKYLFVLFLFFLVACNLGNKSNGKNSQVKRDTLIINKKVFYLDSITKSEFESITKTKYSDADQEIIDDTALVHRDSLKLTFHLTNGADSVLVNDTTEDWAKYKRFVYMESCKDMDYWMVKIIFYEGYGFLLVDKNNGEKVWIWSHPVVSPDKKNFVCYSCDLEAGYIPNGIQMFEISNRKAVLKWTIDLNEWGPSEIYWRNDSTMFIEQLRIDFKDSKNPDKYSYKSMVVK